MHICLPLRNSVDLQKVTKLFWILFLAQTKHYYFTNGSVEINIVTHRSYLKKHSFKKIISLGTSAHQSVNSQL